MICKCSKVNSKQSNRRSPAVMMFGGALKRQTLGLGRVFVHVYFSLWMGVFICVCMCMLVCAWVCGVWCMQLYCVWGFFAAC